MFPQVLKRLRECIRERRYVMTLHAEEEMDHDDLSIFDVERAVLTGEIIERQKDRETGSGNILFGVKPLKGLTSSS